mmetsp:Transcript_1554/g.6780  ORF Transcript_1554/g.6780 Transcript_1554/m.6780 type:complete len:254 (-) Transcript_1554:172-933(-)
MMSFVMSFVMSSVISFVISFSIVISFVISIVISFVISIVVSLLLCKRRTLFVVRGTASPECRLKLVGRVTFRAVDHVHDDGIESTGQSLREGDPRRTRRSVEVDFQLGAKLHKIRGVVIGTWRYAVHVETYSAAEAFCVELDSLRRRHLEEMKLLTTRSPHQASTWTVDRPSHCMLLARCPRGLPRGHMQGKHQQSEGRMEPRSTVALLPLEQSSETCHLDPLCKASVATGATGHTAAGAKSAVGRLCGGESS